MEEKEWKPFRKHLDKSDLNYIIYSIIISNLYKQLPEQLEEKGNDDVGLQ
jgi:hypothetical protein